jgi:hypothetical protein
VLRILIIEDDPARERSLLSWLPADIKAVVARSAGAAMGILRLDSGRVYAGVILDHDLAQAPMSASDPLLSGQNVVHAIAEHVDLRIPGFGSFKIAAGLQLGPGLAFDETGQVKCDFSGGSTIRATHPLAVPVRVEMNSPNTYEVRHFWWRSHLIDASIWGDVLRQSPKWSTTLAISSRLVP